MPLEDVEPGALRQAEEIRLEDADGGTRRVGGAWSDRPALLAVLRHFG
jgi:hypothetical protein